MLPEKLDEGSHEEGRDDRPDTDGRAKEKADEHANEIRAHADKAERPGFLLANRERDEIVRRNAEIRLKVEGGGEAKEQKSYNQNNYPKPKRRIRENAPETIPGPCRHIPQKEEVDKRPDSNLAPGKDEHGDEKHNVENEIAGSKIQGHHVPDPVRERLEGIEPKGGKVSKTNADPREQDAKDRHQNTFYIFRHERPTLPFRHEGLIQKYRMQLLMHLPKIDSYVIKNDKIN